MVHLCEIKSLFHHFRNPSVVIPEMFQFLVLLSYDCFQPKYSQAKSIIVMPQIIQLCDGIMACGQQPTTHGKSFDMLSVSDEEEEGALISHTSAQLFSSVPQEHKFHLPSIMPRSFFKSSLQLYTSSGLCDFLQHVWLCVFVCVAMYVCLYVCLCGNVCMFICLFVWQCMYVYMFVCVAMYVCLYVCLCGNVCMFICLFVWLCIYIYMFVCVAMYVCLYVCMCGYVCMFICLYVWQCMYVYMFVCVAMYVCLYVCLCGYVCMFICLFVWLCMYVSMFVCVVNLWRLILLEAFEIHLK